MRSSVKLVHEMVSQLRPIDETEDAHRSHVLRWLSGTDDVFRRVKPAVPPQHLVSYVVPIDPADGSVLLVDHINAGLWLPPGGHVEVDEHPALTARREIREELGLVVEGQALDDRPMFLTVTRTVGMDAGHTDVSLWFVLDCGQGQVLRPDRDEFHRVRWWTPAEVQAADPSRFDPHFLRFLGKLGEHRAIAGWAVPPL
jgi:8-oxo-dGTP pyrophosphatase MutT (NUDIX family)